MLCKVTVALGNIQINTLLHNVESFVTKIDTNLQNSIRPILPTQYILTAFL